MLTSQFNALLSRNFVPQRNLAEYAALLGVSANHLNKCVKNTLGKTATDLLDEYLLLEIKVLLRQSDLSFGQIAEQLAFSDLTHLGRFFKKKTDQTLTEFRRLD
jgi:AraC-like DNA-binding protein